MVRDPRLQRKLPGDVRLHGVWLLCYRHRQRIFPERKSVRFVNAVVDAFWRGIFDAPLGSFGARSVHGPQWPARWVVVDVRNDVDWDFFHRVYAQLRNNWFARPNTCFDWTASSGIFRGNGTRWRLGVFVGDRHSGSQGILRKLAIGQPTSGGDVCSLRGRDT